jgi:1,4-dihydroxy-2-naphthoate octaprenyltransferase
VSGPWILLSFLAVPRLLTAWKIYSRPRPAAKPENWPVWPLWYVGWALYFNREAGKWFILGLLLNLLVPVVIGVLG